MPTTNPVPSTDPTDLLFNAGKLDEVVNGTANSFTDRLGVARRTVAGMNADFDAQLADAESDLNVYRADAAASAAEALGYLQTIRATSYGAYASDPATDPLGNPPTVGDEYFNTTANLLKRWNGTTWQASDINTANLASPSGSSLVGYLPAGTGAVATTVHTQLRNAGLTSENWNLLDHSITPAQRAEKIEQFWSYCATNNLRCVMLPGEYLVDDWRPGASNHILEVPSNLEIHFCKGSVIRRAAYGASVPTFCRIVSINGQQNVRISGLLEIDGSYSPPEAGYSEHNHNLFIYNSTDVSIEEVYSYDAMGDCLGISGERNTGGLMSERVRIGKVRLLTAGRKSLVVEACRDCWIGDAVLNNGTSNCFDYEPFSVNADNDVISIRIDSLACYSGTDFTSGTTNALSRVSHIGIGDWRIISGASQTSGLILSYAASVKVDRLTIDARKSNSLTGRLMNLEQGAVWSIDHLDVMVPTGYSQDSISITTSTVSSPATLLCRHIAFSGSGLQQIRNRGVLRCNQITFNGIKPNTCRLLAESTTASHVTDVDSIVSYDATSSTTLVDMYTIGSTYPRLQRVGNIAVYDSTATDALPGVVRAYTELSQERITVGGVTVTGQAPTNVVAIAPGGVPFFRMSGGYGIASTYWLRSTASTPENVIPAKLGSICLAESGKAFLKTGGDTLKTGWVQVQTL